MNILKHSLRASRFSSTSAKSLQYEPKSKDSVVNLERTHNRVELMGRVGQDPRMIEKKIPTDDPNRPEHVTRFSIFSLATSEKFRVNKPDMPGQNEEQFRTDWHRICVKLPTLQERVKQVRKGDRVFVSGRLHYDFIKDTKSSEAKFITSIICDDIIFLARSRRDDEEKDFANTMAN